MGGQKPRGIRAANIGLSPLSPMTRKQEGVQKHQKEQAVPRVDMGVSRDAEGHTIWDMSKEQLWGRG